MLIILIIICLVSYLFFKIVDVLSGKIKKNHRLFDEQFLKLLDSDFLEDEVNVGSMDYFIFEAGVIEHWDLDKLDEFWEKLGVKPQKEFRKYVLNKSQMKQRYEQLNNLISLEKGAWDFSPTFKFKQFKDLNESSKLKLSELGYKDGDYSIGVFRVSFCHLGFWELNYYGHEYGYKAIFG